MPSQIPAFSRTVAARMEAYRQRMATRIRAERERRGLQPRDVAYRIHVDPRTVERWESGETAPQLRHLKALAEEWGLEISDLRPDLEAEERALAEQLERIERKLDEIMRMILREADTAGGETGLPAEPPTPPAPLPSAPDETEPRNEQEGRRQRAG